MVRVTICAVGIVAAVFTAFAGDESANLDVAGIKIGMGVKEAMAAIKADNPKLYVKVASRSMDGFPHPLHAAVSAEQGITLTNDAEDLVVLFTMPPNKEQVWAIRRHTSWRPENRPSTEKTIAALRQKYGKENVSSNPALGMRTVHLTWIYGADGKLLPAEEAAKLNTKGYASSIIHFGNDDMASFNELQTGKPQTPPEVDQLITINADVQSTETESNNGHFVVYNLIVWMNNGPMYRTAIDATRAQALAGANAHNARDGNEVDKRAGPKL